MILVRMEIVCAHSSMPRAHDAKHPCESVRNRSIAVDVEGNIDDAARAARRQIADRGWKMVPCQAIGRRKAPICPSCQRREAGEI